MTEIEEIKEQMRILKRQIAKNQQAGFTHEENAHLFEQLATLGEHKKILFDTKQSRGVTT